MLLYFADSEDVIRLEVASKISYNTDGFIKFWQVVTQVIMFLDEAYTVEKLVIEK